MIICLIFLHPHQFPGTLVMDIYTNLYRIYVIYNYMLQKLLNI